MDPATAAEAVDRFFAGAFTKQVSNYSPSSSGGTFAPEMLYEALDKIYNAPVTFHGCEQNPHLYHPVPGFFYHRYCAVCLRPRDNLTTADAVADIRPLPAWER